MGPILKTSITSVCSAARVALPERVEVDRWVRYTIALGDTPASSPEVALQPVTDAIMADLRNHPDRNERQLRSGFRFWDRGLRRAFIWQLDGGPACVQWLLLPDDIRALHSLGEWSGMYAPLPERCGQVENLFAFSTARRKGVATQFEYALFAAARQMGLVGLVTHIHEQNVAARGWADRTGWREYGVIARYHADFPGLRGFNVCVHTNGGARAPAVVRQAPVGAASA